MKSFYVQKLDTFSLANEKRREPRIVTEESFMVRFKRKGLFESSWGMGAGRDLSLNGVRFATHVKLKEKDRLECSFYFSPRFPGPTRIDLKATVVRTYLPKDAERFRVGCKLHHVNEESREMLRQFLWWLELCFETHADSQAKTA